MSITEFVPQSYAIWEDESILVVNKPAGLLTIQDGYHPNLPNLLNLLTQVYGKLWVVHRLDKETSGILIFSRTPEAHRLLNAAFRNRQVKKTYHAISMYPPFWEEYECTLPLRVNGDRQHKTVIDEQRGKPAKTHFRVLKRFEAGCLLEAQPVSGYTHQIRAHCFYLGVPILGDSVYSFPNDKKEVRASRLALHAKEIEFDHPLMHQTLRFCAHYHQDFLALLEQFG